MDFRVPAFYVLSRQCPVDDVTHVLALLSLTPVEGIIISDACDIPLARQFGVLTVQAGSDANALAMAAHLSKHNARVSLVIGDAPAQHVQMVYADETKENIPYLAS